MKTKLIEYYDKLSIWIDEEKKNRKMIMKAYNEWVVEQPSIIDGDMNVSKPHHVRTATNSCMGKKPHNLWTVPITYKQHTAFHKHGTYRQLFEDKLPELHDQFLNDCFLIKRLVDKRRG